MYPSTEEEYDRMSGNNMLHGKFVGPTKLLRNKTALIQEIKGDSTHVLAQFDDFSLPLKYTHNWVKVAKRYIKFLKE